MFIGHLVEKEPDRDIERTGHDPVSDGPKPWSNLEERLHNALEGEQASAVKNREQSKIDERQVARLAPKAEQGDRRPAGDEENDPDGDMEHFPAQLRSHHRDGEALREEWNRLKHGKGYTRSAQPRQTKDGNATKVLAPNKLRSQDSAEGEVAGADVGVEFVLAGAAFLEGAE